MKTVNMLRYIFDKKQKITVLKILFQIIIGTILELVGVTAVLPFIEVAMDADKIHINKAIELLYDFFRFESIQDYLAFMAILLILIYILKNFFLVYLNYNIYRFNYDNQRLVAKKLLDTYLKEPYIFFLNHNSADLVRNIKEDTIGLFDTIIASMQLLAEGMVTLVLFLYLLYKDKTITLTVGVVLILFVFFVMKKIKHNVEMCGSNVRLSKGGMTKWILQTFGGIKETLILGRTDFFEKKVDEQYCLYSNSQKKYQVLSYIPKPLLETICVGTILFAIIIKLQMGVSPDYFVSTVAIFAVAAFRLLPAFNRITIYINRIHFGKPSLIAVYDDLRDIENHVTIEEKRGDNRTKFEESIEIIGVDYKYPDSNSYVLKDIGLKILKNKSVAFIGASGAGKTTLADVILGLLDPQSGDILVDGVSVLNSIENWRMCLGYIPQTIFLLDDTIKANIAYGLEENSVDETKLKKAIEDAQLKEFIDSLEDGLNTVIGERGVRLSGGQRQRIGIARALYNDPEVLILDEATSALDNDTESAVMEAIDSLSGRKTLIIIAHRLSTIKNCDYVYEITPNGIIDKTGSIN